MSILTFMCEYEFEVKKPMLNRCFGVELHISVTNMKFNIQSAEVFEVKYEKAKEKKIEKERDKARLITLLNFAHRNQRIELCCTKEDQFKPQKHNTNGDERYLLILVHFFFQIKTHLYCVLMN